MIVYGNIRSTAKRVKKSTIKTIKEKKSKQVYKQKAIFAPRGDHTII